MPCSAMSSATSSEHFLVELPSLFAVAACGVQISYGGSSHVSVEGSCAPSQLCARGVRETKFM